MTRRRPRSRPRPTCSMLLHSRRAMPRPRRRRSRRGSTPTRGATRPLLHSTSTSPTPTSRPHPSSSTRTSSPSPLTQPANLAAYLRPVPPYFLFSFHLNPVAVRLALELDPELGLCRDSLVPVRLKEKRVLGGVLLSHGGARLAQRGRGGEGWHGQGLGVGRAMGVRSETFVEDGPIEADTPRSAAAAAAAAAAATASGGSGGGYVPPGASDSGSGERYLASLMGGGGGAAAPAMEASVGAAANGGYVPPSLDCCERKRGLYATHVA